MDASTRQALLHAIAREPAIACAAVTGSTARKRQDAYSDVDVLIVTRDPEWVRRASTWLPTALRVLICERHLSHYTSILLESFDQVDLAVFKEGDDPAEWVVHDYEVIKGDQEFHADLARAARETRVRRAARIAEDACVGNVLLLLATADRRMRRGELVSAHGLLVTAATMLTVLDERWVSHEQSDSLDPHRRIERIAPEVAHAVHTALFTTPERGIASLARAVRDLHGAALRDGERFALEHLLQGSPPSLGG